MVTMDMLAVIIQSMEVMVDMVLFHIMEVMVDMVLDTVMVLFHTMVDMEVAM